MGRTVWSVLLIVLLAGALPLATVAQTEPDLDDDPYDQVTCLGVPEDEMEDLKTVVPNPGGPIDMEGSSSRNGGNDPYEFSPFPNNGFQLPFDDQGSGSNSNEFSFQPTYTSEEEGRANGSFYDEPQVSLQLSTPTAVPGEDVVGTVQYDTFSSGSEQPGSTFYTVVIVDGVFVNGYMAGGSAEALEQLQVAATDPARPDCGTLRRQTQSDEDGDGMDDGWELRYGLDPTNPGDAGQDPDGDGFEATTLRNLEGEAVVPAPPIANAELGDGRFTNYEEFVFDTDPKKPDTDGDGHADEEDVVGFGQPVVKFPARKAIGEPAYQVRLIVAGRTGKLNEDAQALVKLDSVLREVQVGTRENLEVSLNLVQGAAPGGTLRIEAEPSGTERLDLLNVYRWSINGELLTAQSGQGRRTLEYPIPPEQPTGTELAVSLDLINDQTGQLARGRLNVVVGDTILFDYDPESVESGAFVTVHALLTSVEPASGFLFNWELDRLAQPRDSRIGAQDFTFAVSAAPGQEHQVGLTVYRVSDSSLIGQLEQSLLVLQPIVTLEITPDPLVVGQTALAHAATDHFASTTLKYEFSIDGVQLASQGSSASFTVAQEGTHTIRVTVSSSAPRAESGSASREVTALSGSTGILSSASSGGTLSAALIRTSSLGSAIGVVALAGLLLRRKVGKAQLA